MKWFRKQQKLHPRVWPLSPFAESGFPLPFWWGVGGKEQGRRNKTKPAALGPLRHPVAPRFLACGWLVTPPTPRPAPQHRVLSCITPSAGRTCSVLSSHLPPLTPSVELRRALYFLFANAVLLNDTWRGVCSLILHCPSSTSSSPSHKILGLGFQGSRGVGLLCRQLFAIDFYLIEGRGQIPPTRELRRRDPS